MEKQTSSQKAAATRAANKAKEQADSAARARQTRIDKEIDEVIMFNRFLDGKEPRRFEVGESVVVGNLDDPTIKSIVDDRGVYEVEYETEVKDTFGRKIGETTRTTNIFPWYGIFRPVPDSERYCFDHVRMDFMTIDVGGLISHCHFGINMDPDYQRGLVWSDEDRNRLITTIMSGGDIGKVILARNDYSSDGDLYEVIDGKQRIDTVVKFYLGRFTWKTPLGTEVAYEQLSYRERNFFKSSRLSCAVLENNPSRETRIKAFLQVNDTGRRVDEAHIARIREMLSK